MSKEKKVTVSVRLDKETYERLTQICKDNCRSLSSQIQYFIRNGSAQMEDGKAQ